MTVKIVTDSTSDIPGIRPNAWASAWSRRTSTGAFNYSGPAISPSGPTEFR